MTSIFFLAALIIFVYMTLGFFAAVIKKRNDLVDPMWGAGFALVAIGTYAVSEQTFIGLLLSILVSLWATRLTVRLVRRVLHKKDEEDFRYKKWRETWMKKGTAYFVGRSFLQIFMLQGLLMFMISLAFVAANAQGQIGGPMSGFFNVSLGFLTTGIIVWIIGFSFEVVGDSQLSTFIKNPENRGKIMQSGLWKYSRHPNYFGEATLWWGIWLIALSAGIPLWTIISPITITFLLLKVSGVPMLEAQWDDNEEYQAYKKKTSVFLPLPRKK